MILPESGSVIIVDDEILEALPLINALSNKSVPVYYFDGKKNLPERPLKNVRMMFLDMRYSSVSDSKSVISTLMGIIDSIIEINNGPYLMLIWSKHDSFYLEEFIQTINTDQGSIAKPVLILNMDKNECFESEEEEQLSDDIIKAIEEIAASKDEDLNDILSTLERSRKKKMKENGLDIIEERLKTEMEKTGCFNLFYIWENIVNNAAGDIIKSISSVAEMNDKWDENIRSLLHKLAEAFAGKKNLHDKDNNLDIDLVIENIFYSLNEILPDEINTLVKNNDLNAKSIEISREVPLVCLNDNGTIYSFIRSSKFYKFNVNSNNIKNFESIESFFADVDTYEGKNHAEALMKIHLQRTALVNSKLLLQNNPINMVQPGNVYLLDNAQERIIDISKGLFTVTIEPFLDKLKYVELEISPACDHAQQKWETHRILPGIYVPYEFVSMISKTGDFIYNSPLLIRGAETFKLVFNFKHFTSEKIGYFEEKSPTFKLRSSLQLEIKNRLSQHFMRSGIVELLA